MNIILNIYDQFQYMFVFDLSLSSIGSAGSVRTTLPPLSEWLRPTYAGPGDLASRKELRADKGVNDPANWEEDFADYNYTYPENLLLKDKINAEKNKISPIRDDPGSNRKFDSVSSACNKYEDLRGRRGVLVQNYNAEIVTNAWMKMYECMSLLEEPILSKLSKNANEDHKSFHSFHIAEAPGNFMVAMNHYLYSHYPNLDWRWLANSYRDLYSSNTYYLTDTYGLIQQHKDRWVFGADGDGDITSSANIRSFAAKVQSEFGTPGKSTSILGGLHFITSDVKFVPPDVNYDEEEFQNIPVQMGHMLSSLVTLRKGGVCMLKEFSFFEAPKMSHLYLLANCFQKLYIVKPETSRPANSEVYVFGIGYKKNLTDLQIDVLYDIMQYTRFMTDKSPSIFKKDAIPKVFAERVHKLNQKLVEKQIPALNRNIDLFRQYEHAHYEEICRDMSSIRANSARDWIKQYGVNELPEKRHIANMQSGPPGSSVRPARHAHHDHS